MRESIGAAWIFSICLTFIILFTAYLAISVNYAKAFRIKSHIISAIEEHEGYNDQSSLDQEIVNYLVSQGYTASGKCEELEGWGTPHCVDQKNNGTCGACIYHMDIDTGNDDICAKRSYYKVVTWFKFDLPIVNFLTTFKVSGDTRYIYDFANSPDCN